MNNLSSSQAILTAQQEGFAQSIVDGKLNQSDSYRANYYTSNMLAKTVNEDASRLAALPKVAARIQQLRDQVTAEVIASRLWDIGRGMDEVVTRPLTSFGVWRHARM